jgi:poly(3-hydroxybutyrate) depolymerase
MLYAAYQALSDGLGLWQQAAGWASGGLNAGAQRLQPWPEPAGWRELAAAQDVFSRLRLTHARPAWGIDHVTVGEGEAAREVVVTEQVIKRRAFGTLLRFARADADQAAESGSGGQPLPRVLIVAPLSGHFATLLADTARTMLADHDIYITDWHNARDVPLAEGGFGLGDYVETVIDFIATRWRSASPACRCWPPRR